VIGDPLVGFEHEFERDHGGENARRVSKALLLNRVTSEHVNDRKDMGQNADNVPNNVVARTKLSVLAEILTEKEGSKGFISGLNPEQAKLCIKISDRIGRRLHPPPFAVSSGLDVTLQEPKAPNITNPVKDPQGSIDAR